MYTDVYRRWSVNICIHESEKLQNKRKLYGPRLLFNFGKDWWFVVLNVSEIAKAYLELYQIFMMELYCEIGYCLKPDNYFHECSIVDV